MPESSNYTLSTPEGIPPRTLPLQGLSPRPTTTILLESSDYSLVSHAWVNVSVTDQPVCVTGIDALAYTSMGYSCSGSSCGGGGGVSSGILDTLEVGPGQGGRGVLGCRTRIEDTLEKVRGPQALRA